MFMINRTKIFGNWKVLVCRHQFKFQYLKICWIQKVRHTVFTSRIKWYFKSITCLKCSYLALWNYFLLLTEKNTLNFKKLSFPLLWFEIKVGIKIWTLSNLICLKFCKLSDNLGETEGFRIVFPLDADIISDSQSQILYSREPLVEVHDSSFMWSQT